MKNKLTLYNFLLFWTLSTSVKNELRFAHILRYHVESPCTSYLFDPELRKTICFKDKLEDANALLARTQEEHRAALGAYEAQVARWKDEAKHLSEKLKSIHEENQEVNLSA